MLGYQSKSPSDLKAELLAAVARIKERHEAELAPYLVKLEKAELAERLVAEISDGFTSTDDPSPSKLTAKSHDLAAPVQSRLRIGEQRYLMLTAIRAAAGGLTDAEVSARTGYGIRRVREQLNADMNLGVLSEAFSKYSLRPDGKLLLERFERSQQDKGNKLPQIDGSREAIRDKSELSEAGSDE